MSRKNNYLIRREEAKKRFLTFDLQWLIEKWQLKQDENNIYVNFLGEEYRIARKTGDVENLALGQQAGFEEVLSIFDLLCHTESRPTAKDSFAPVNSLDGKPRAAAVGTEGTFDKYAKAFDRSMSDLRSACESMHGRRIEIGDLGYEFPVFADLKLRLKFYESDEEFPAQLILLWNSNALDYLYYETAFYVMLYLLERILLTFTAD